MTNTPLPRNTGVEINRVRRRGLLGLLGATALGRVASSAPLAAKPRKRAIALLDMNNPAQLAIAFRKLAHGLEGGVTYWWMRGVRYGVVDNVATPFWEMHTGAWLATRDLDAGQYELRMAYANFYTAPGSDQLLESFANPFNGRTVVVPYAAPKASVSVHGPHGGSAFAGTAPGLDITRNERMGPAVVIGDLLQIRDDLSLRGIPTEPGRRAVAVQDWSTYIGSLEEVSDPSVRNATATQAFTDVLTYPSWLQMGDHPGSFISRSWGRKEFSFGAMPAAWRAYFARQFPALAKDPDAIVGS